MFAYENEAEGDQGVDEVVESNYQAFQSHKAPATFTDKLGFKSDTGSSMLPDYYGDAQGMNPIEIKNGKRNRSKSQKKGVKGVTQKKRPTTAVVANKKKPAAVSQPIQTNGAWNNSTVSEAKFFDKSQDKEFQRRHEREAGISGVSKKSVKFQNSDLKNMGPQVTKDGSMADVKFYSKGGRPGQSVQIYKDIDQLHQDAGYGEDAGRKTYSM